MKNEFHTNALNENIAIKDISTLEQIVQETPLGGYGSCRACGCKGYISKHNGTHECKICGHHYDRHN